MSRLNPVSHFYAFGQLISLLTKHRQLTIEMAKRELSDRYMGQVFGMLWAVGHPLILMGVYVFIFAVVFKLKVGGTLEMPLDYTTYLLSGLIPWLCFQESMAKGTEAITSNANLVKQVVFPIEILPVKCTLAILPSFFVSLGVLTLYVLLTYQSLHVTFLLIPVLVFFQVLAMIGVSYVFSAVGAYFRDLKDFVQVFSVAGVYLLPIFYLPSLVPDLFRPLLYLNPFSYLVWCYQDVLYYGRFEHWWAWVVFIPMSLGVFYLGFRVFMKCKMVFGNVL